MPNEMVEKLSMYVGRTVTIFTESGGLSGSGFTGVLAGICGCTIKLITDVGAPPACPVGSCCSGYYGRDNCGYMGSPCNWLGSVTEIPIDRIVSFVHNAI